MGVPVTYVDGSNHETPLKLMFIKTVTCKLKKMKNMKSHFIIIALVLAISNCFGQYEGPVSAITSGYGSFGTDNVSVSNITINLL